MLLFVNDLTVIDCSYLCESRGMVGESWIVDIELSGDLNDMSMVLDFGKVKKQIKQIIDDTVDHKLLLPIQSGRYTCEYVDPDALNRVTFAADVGTMVVTSPAEAYAFIDTQCIDIDSVSRYLHQILKVQLPSNVQHVKLTLRPEQITSFYYHYTHGLKKHDGNCQRIAHGHRSTIQIFENDIRNPRLQKMWAQRWQDIYLGSEVDLAEADTLALSEQQKQELNDHYFFAYNAPQGRFELVMPKAVCEVVPCDTTVECLAQFIANELHQARPQNHYKVVAYEGVGKGAIAYVG